ncbi:MAG: hypothetical protein V4757_12120 [Pseudomonadota bacterium]
MHVLIGLLILAILGYVVYKTFFAGSAGQSAVPAERSDRPFAFVSNGLLFLRERGAKVNLLQSAYVQEAMDRRERSREKHSWKKGTSFGIAAGGSLRNFEAPDKPAIVTSAAFEPGGHLLYFLKDDSVGGVFRRDAASGNETRVLLKQNLHLGDLRPSPDGTTVAASSQQPDGVANLTLMMNEGSNLREVTGGDTVDSAPSWIPGVPNRLLFQSTGIARSEQGYIVGMGPASIQMLNMESGSVAPVLENAGYDFLKPRVCPAGNLHFIRRPFEPPRYRMENIVLDTLLFPFRLLRAIFHYLNFFSMMYSRKPLTSASGPAMQADIKNILLQGRRIDTEKALRSERPVQGVPSLVPSSWELVSRNPQGDERILATNVASYDISPDGTIVYSNGRGVFVIEKDGAPRLAALEDFVGEVAATAA